jgi:hypothetical protein
MVFIFNLLVILILVDFMPNYLYRSNVLFTFSTELLIFIIKVHCNNYNTSAQIVSDVFHYVCIYNYIYINALSYHDIKYNSYLSLVNPDMYNIYLH